MTARASQLWIPLAAVAALAFHAVHAAEPVQRAGSLRTVVVIGDLHMGVGRDQSGSWHPYEDFRWGAEFSGFLQAIDAEGRGSTDLVLNGDTFELLQSTGKDCAYAEANLGCTESEALGRLNRVLAAHEAEMKALSDFARSGSNSLVFVPGDHDVALLFPSLGRRLTAALSTAKGRVTMASSGYWLSENRQIYTEHGHQIGFTAEKLDAWPAPFVRRQNRAHLLRSRGEQAIQDYIDGLEERYPVIDNVAERGMGVKYGLVAEGTTDAGDAAWRLLRYFLLRMSNNQFSYIAFNEADPPVWDVAKVRVQGPAFLVESLVVDDPFRPLATKALSDGRLAQAMQELSDEELMAICDYHRGAVSRARRRMESPSQFPPSGPALPECPRTADTAGPAFDYFFNTRNVVFARYLETIGKNVTRGGQSITLFVHNHTHFGDRSGTNALYFPLVPLGFSPVRKAITPVVVNGGAWQRTTTPLELERMKAQRGVSFQDLLRSMQPEQLAPCYGFVHIAPYSKRPVPTMRYWRRAAGGGAWEFAESCAG